MNAIDALFQQLRTSGRKAFMPFISAGDPDLQTTFHLLPAMAAAGAHLIEIGFPFSDPIADGPVIQASYTRALEKGIRVGDIIAGLQALKSKLSVPLVGMVSYTLVYRRGPVAFLDQAQAAGLSGIIVPDLPIDEAEELVAAAVARDFKVIQLITPTTPRERAVRIARLSSGFLYYVSVAGITGERDRLPDELIGQLTWLRGQTDLPVCVGFGISKPEHVRMLRDVADGVVVGSALVRRLEQASSKSLATVTTEITSLVRELSLSLNATDAGAREG